ncbi:hypothetical protein [Elizabethkingia bruuniana]|uniref:hypothetical protein n=1 Tax=Elizabethkingia bruuniana TaxID=1756149 RepID=UPI00241EC4F0|nr:hypothetical protein [Elizabethkingia bruuniana]
MNQLIEKLELKNNELKFANSKRDFPELFNTDEIEPETSRLNDEFNVLKNEAESITKIEDKKELLYAQLTEYIKVIEKEYKYPFSKSQGFGFPMFYISPLVDIKNILFLDFKGISGVILNLTADSKDAVNNKTQFLNFLKEKRNDFNNAQNLFELYTVYRSFDEIIKSDFR